MEVAAFESGRIMSLVGTRRGILLYTYTDKVAPITTTYRVPSLVPSLVPSPPPQWSQWSQLWWRTRYEAKEHLHYHQCTMYITNRADSWLLPDLKFAMICFSIL